MKYNDAETRSFGVPHFVTAFSKDDLCEFTDLPFEGHMLIGPRNYDTILKQCYGDYMTPPPPEERINHLVECCWKE